MIRGEEGVDRPLKMPSQPEENQLAEAGATTSDFLF